MANKKALWGTLAFLGVAGAGAGIAIPFLLKSDDEEEKPKERVFDTYKDSTINEYRDLVKADFANTFSDQYGQTAISSSELDSLTTIQEIHDHAKAWLDKGVYSQGALGGAHAAITTHIMTTGATGTEDEYKLAIKEEFKELFADAKGTPIKFTDVDAAQNLAGIRTAALALASSDYSAPTDGAKSHPDFTSVQMPSMKPTEAQLDQYAADLGALFVGKYPNATANSQGAAYTAASAKQAILNEASSKEVGEIFAAAERIANNNVFEKFTTSGSNAPRVTVNFDSVSIPSGTQYTHAQMVKILKKLDDIVVNYSSTNYVRSTDAQIDEAIKANPSLSSPSAMSSKWEALIRSDASSGIMDHPHLVNTYVNQWKKVIADNQPAPSPTQLAAYKTSLAQKIVGKYKKADHTNQGATYTLSTAKSAITGSTWQAMLASAKSLSLYNKAPTSAANGVKSVIDFTSLPNNVEPVLSGTDLQNRITKYVADLSQLIVGKYNTSDIKTQTAYTLTTAKALFTGPYTSYHDVLVAAEALSLYEAATPGARVTVTVPPIPSSVLEAYKDSLVELFENAYTDQANTNKVDTSTITNAVDAATAKTAADALAAKTMYSANKAGQEVSFTVPTPPAFDAYKNVLLAEKATLIYA